MEIEIKYTNVNGSVRNIKANSPDEAEEMLSALPGYNLTGMDAMFKDAMDKVAKK